MEVIIEIIIKEFLIDFLGINTRYYFFRIFNKNIKKESLSVNQNEIVSGFAQGFYNFFVGIFMFSLLVALMVYLLHILGLL
jgi:hypothetical protein